MPADRHASPHGGDRRTWATELAAGAPLVVCLLVLMLVPLVTIIAYETRGRFHQATMLARLSQR